MGQFPLEGDGCVVSLFHYIWNKNNHKKSCPLVNLPDTIVYKYRQPAYWYFTSKDPAGGIKMKNKQNLGNVRVEESLCNKPANSNNEVVAYYISSENTPQGTVTTMEHFDSNGLRDFLYHHDKENNGILQRFIDSKGSRNTVFRAIWSPNVFHVERRTNMLDISDRKQSLHQRVVTFEGEEHFSTPLTVTDTLLGSQVQRICESIVDHCAVHLHAQGMAAHVSRMVLHFKVDDNSRVWLLWCSSVRLSPDEIQFTHLCDSTPIDIHSLLTVPSNIKRLLGPRGSEKPGRDRHQDFVCGPCQLIHGDLCVGVVDRGRMCEITYKMVMDYFEHHKSDVTNDPGSVSWMPSSDDASLANDDVVPESDADGDLDMSALMGAGNGEHSGGLWRELEPVPHVFKKMHPNLTPDNYALLKKDPLFLYSRMAVCDQCFLLLTADQAPRLPIVERMPSSLLMERNHGSIANSIGASMGVPVSENLSSLRQSSISPVNLRGGRDSVLRGRDSVLSGRDTRLSLHAGEGVVEDGRRVKEGSERGGRGGRGSVLGGSRSHSSIGQSPSMSSGMMHDEDRYVKKPTKPRLVPPMDTGIPLKLAGYSYAGNNLLSRAPRRSTRVAENYVSSVATSQFTTKVEQRVQPLQMTQAPQTLDFVANNVLPAARSLLADGGSASKALDSSVALSVLAREEAFLRTLHPGLNEPRRKVGREEEGRLARAAAAGVKKQLQSGKKEGGAAAAVAAGGDVSEGGDEAGGDKEGLSPGGLVALREEDGGGEGKGSSNVKGPVRRARARSWLDSSPLLPGGAAVKHAAGAKGKAPSNAEYTMYLAASGTGAARAAGVGARGAEAAADESFDKWTGPKTGEDGMLPEGVAAAIEMAKELKAQKLREEHAARMAAEKARMEAEQMQRRAEVEYLNLQKESEDESRKAAAARVEKKDLRASRDAQELEAEEKQAVSATSIAEAPGSESQRGGGGGVGGGGGGGAEEEAAARKIQARQRGISDRKRVEEERAQGNLPGQREASQGEDATAEAGPAASAGAHVAQGGAEAGAEVLTERAADASTAGAPQEAGERGAEERDLAAEGVEGGEEGEGGEAWHEHVGGAKRNADGDGTAPAKEAAAARAQAAEAQGAEATVAPAAEDVPVTVPEEGKEEEGTPETDADAPAAVASDAVEQAAPAEVEKAGGEWRAAGAPGAEGGVEAVGEDREDTARIEDREDTARIEDSEDTAAATRIGRIARIGEDSEDTAGIARIEDSEDPAAATAADDSEEAAAVAEEAAAVEEEAAAVDACAAGEDKAAVEEAPAVEGGAEAATGETAAERPGDTEAGGDASAEAMEGAGGVGAADGTGGDLAEGGEEVRAVAEGATGNVAVAHVEGATGDVAVAHVEVDGNVAQVQDIA